MTTANQAFTFNNPVQRIPFPASGGTTSSGTFSVPLGAKVATMYIPDLATDANCKLQGLTPTETVEASQAWVDLEVFSLVDGSLVALDGLTKAHAITLPTAALGGGVLRFTTVTTQAPAPLVVYIVWGMDG